MALPTIGCRNVGLAVKQATAVDHLWGGRAVLGRGAGWHPRHHAAFRRRWAAGQGVGSRRVLSRITSRTGRARDGESSPVSIAPSSSAAASSPIS